MKVVQVIIVGQIIFVTQCNNNINKDKNKGKNNKDQDKDDKD